MKAKALRALITVSGGCADITTDPGVDSELFDFDNYSQAPDDTPKVSARFADLASKLDAPTEAQPASTDSPQPRLLVTVRGGVAYWLSSGSLEVVLADEDNAGDEDADDEERFPVPPSFTDLAQQAGVIHLVQH